MPRMRSNNGPSGGTSVAPDGLHAPLILSASLIGFFMTTLDAVIVNVALPRIGHELSGEVSALQWVVDAYTLMFAGVLLSAGSLADRLGPHRAFGSGMALFTAASIACGLAPTMGLLVASRFAQGAAAAVMMPASMALIGNAFPDPRKRARAVGIWAMGGAVASSSGPLLGGLLVEASWRLIFFVNVPAGLLALLILTRTTGPRGHAVPFDVTGQLAAVVAMGGLTYSAIESGSAGVASARVRLSFIAAVAAIALFIASQRWGRHPALPLDVLTIRGVRFAIMVGFAFMVGFYGMPFVMSLYLQREKGLSPLTTGTLFVPMMLEGLILTPFIARLAHRFGHYTLVAFGMGSMAVGLAVIASQPANIRPVGYLLPMMLVGLAGPLAMPPVMTLLLHSVPTGRAGIVSGAFHTSRQVAGALAIAVFGALIANRKHFYVGLQECMGIAAVVAAAAAAAALQRTWAERSQSIQLDPSRHREA